MNGNLKTLAFIFSVILNVVFAGTTAHYSLSSPQRQNQAPANCPLLYEELNLTKDQLEELEPIRDRFHERMGRISGDIRKKQLQLVNLLAASTSDRDAIRAIQEEIRDLQQFMQSLVVNHLVEDSSILTPEQRSGFFRAIRNKIEGNRRACPSFRNTLGDAP